MDAPGWFGKLACLGDFAARRLTPDCVQLCDDWLSVCVARSRARLGAQWLPAYLQAPVWRYAWSPGIVDAQWWLGLLMPSCDSVGRYFPLLVMRPGPTLPALDQVGGWYDALESAATRTLADRASVDAFEAALAAVGAWSASPASPAGRDGDARGRSWWWRRGGGGAADGCTGLPDADHYARMLLPACPVRNDELRREA